MRLKVDNALKSSSYDILSQQSFSAGDILFLDLDDTLIYEHFHDKPVLMHPKLPSLLHKLQDRGVICVGLTARVPGLAETTQKQLSILGLSFNLAQRLFADSTLQHGEQFYYKDGVLYSPSNSQNGNASTKGEAAVFLLQALKTLDTEKLAQNGLNKQRVGRRIFALDDLPINIDAIKKSLSAHTESLNIQSMELKAVHKKPLLVANHQDKSEFPDLSMLKLVASIAQVEGVYVLKDSQGNQYTFTASVNLNHLKERMLADILYQLLDCPVPDFAIVSEIPPCLESQYLPRNGFYRLAKLIVPNEEKQSESCIVAQFSQHFLVDVLLSNWDIASLKNIILGQNGVLYRIDNGGALRYRAQGSLKHQKPEWSAHHVNELEFLQNALYGQLSEEALKLQHQKIVKHTNALFQTLSQVEEILTIHEFSQLPALIASRLYDLELRLHPTSHPYALAFESIKADKKQNSASILPMANVHGTPCFLLGRRVAHQWFSDLGGESEHSDGDLAKTASREAYEETAGQVDISQAYLLDRCLSHDLITYKNNRQHTHRMYMVEQRYIPSTELLKEVKNSPYDQECTKFAWIPIKALLAAIQSHSTVEEEGEETLHVQYIDPETGQTNQITLFPPIAKMFAQAPVKEALQKREQGHTLSLLSKKRTRSHDEQNYQCFQTAPRVLRFENKEEASIKMRTLDYGMSHLVHERVYPDPLAERRNLVKNTVLSAQVKQQIKSKKHKVDLEENKEKPLRTQSLAHLKGILESKEEDPEYLVHEYFNKEEDLSKADNMSFRRQVIEIIKAEALYPQHVVLYHGTNSKMGFFYDFISMLRGLLMVQEDIRCLRAFDKLFENIINVDDFVSEQCKKQQVKDKTQLSNYDADYQEKGLSCNFSLFFNVDTNSSSSLDFFYENRACSKNNKLDLHNAITMVLEHLNIKNVTPNQILSLYFQYEKHLSGHLYQIFINSAQVDALCYFSASGGSFHDFTIPWLQDAKPEDQHKLSKVAWALRANPHSFLNNEVLKKKGSLQARLLLHPALMHKFVNIRTYKTHENPPLLEKELLFFIQQITQELLQKKQDLQQNYRYSTYGEEKLTTLQRLHKYVIQGETKEELSYVKDYSSDIETLYQHIHSGDTQGFEALLQSIPLGVNLNQLATNFASRGHEKEPLLHQAIQYKCLDIVKILLKSMHLNSQFLMHLNKKGEAALIFAVKENLHEMVTILLDSEYCTSACLMHSQTNALLIAIEKRNLVLLKILVESKHCGLKHMMYVNEEGYNALTLALSRDDMAAVTILVKSTKYTAECLLQSDKKGQNALILAIKRKDEETIRFLREICTPDFLQSLADKYYHSVLMWAESAGFKELVQILLENACYREKFLMPMDEDKNTLLIWAIKHNHQALWGLVLKSKHCTPEFLMQANKDGDTALMLLVRQGQQEDRIRKFLENKHFRVECLLQANKTDETLLDLIFASTSEDIIPLFGYKCPSYFLLKLASKFFQKAIILAASSEEALKAILESRDCTEESLLQIDDSCGSLLHWAIKHCPSLAIRLIKNEHCTLEVLKQNDNRMSPLEQAIYENQTELIKAILESVHCSGELYINKDNAGSILHSALFSTVEILNVLLQSTFCTPDVFMCTDSCGNNILMAAVAYHDIEKVKALLDCKTFTKKCLLQTYREEGDNVLTLAVKKGNVEVVQLLLTSQYVSSAYLMHTDTKGHNAMSLSLAGKDKNIIDFLHAIATPEFLLAQAGKFFHSALIWAESAGYDTVVQSLLNIRLFSKKCKESMDEDRNTLVTWSLEHDFQSLFLKLLKNKYGLREIFTRVNKKGETTLILAAKKHYTNIVEIIVNSAYCDSEFLMQADSEGDTALLKAEACCALSIIQILFESKSFKPQCLVQVNKWGHTFLNEALDYPDKHPILQLLRQQCTTEVLLSFSDNYFHLSLMYAAKVGQIDAMSSIVNSSYCTEEKLLLQIKYGTLLTWAIGHDHPELALSLIENRKCTLRVLLKKEEGLYNPLALAVSKDQIEVVKAILSSIHFSSKVMFEARLSAESVLLWAVMQKAEKMVQALIESGKCFEEDVERALNLAIETEQTQTVILIKKSKIVLSNESVNDSLSIRFLGNTNSKKSNAQVQPPVTTLNQR